MPRSERPLDAIDSALGQFAADLRGLREKMGSPTYRELGKRAHYAPATLSQAASGRKLPSLAVTLAYVEACDGDVGEWRERWRSLATQLNAEDEPSSVTGRAPYLGLAAFQLDDADRFFGREPVIRELTEMVRARRFTGVFGASGSGKSSVLRAGLLARTSHPAVLLTPGARPIEECAVRLAEFAGVPATTLVGEFAADPANLHLRIRQALGDRELLIVVDQFEELFTQCADEAQRAWFVDALVTAANAPASRARVVLGVRADFYGLCGRYPALVDALRGGQVLVGDMGTEQLRRAITQPAMDAGCIVETALVSRMIADATGQPAALPLVSHALLETWRRRSGATLTLGGYEATGGIHHAIAHSAEQVYRDLTPAQQQAARSLFLRLTTPGESTEDSKRRIQRRELDTGDVDTVVERLVRARLLTVDHDSVDIAHEALIRCWPRLRAWLAEDRAGVRTHRQLTDATEAWESHWHEPSTLYRGTRLAAAREWAAANSTALNSRERRFLDASTAAEVAEQGIARHRTRRFRQLVALLGVLLLLTGVTIALAMQAQQDATDQRNIAIARRVLTDATAMRQSNAALSLQLTLAAHQIAPLPETRDALLSSSAMPYENRLTGHTSKEIFLAYSPDGQTLATVSWDRTLRLWNVADGRQTVSLTVRDPLMSVAFGQSGRTMATVGQSSIRLWDVSDPHRPAELWSQVTSVTTMASVVFNHDARIMVTATDEKTAQVWDISDPRRPTPLGVVSGAPDRIGVVAFSPDGRSLAAAGGATAQLWDMSTPADPRPLGVLNGHTALISGVSFSPDGRTVATASWDRRVKLWDVSAPSTPRDFATLTAHTSSVSSVAFSRDGQFLASTGNGTILWDVSDIAQPRHLITFPGGQYSVAFSPDGTALAAADDDKTVRLQALAAIPLVGHHDFVVAVAYHPDGRILATGSWDGTVRLWDVTDPHSRRPLAALRVNTGPIRSVMFSPDRRTFATANDNGVVRLWDLADPRRPRQVGSFQPDSREIVSLAFTPDGRTLAAGGFRTVSLWDVTDRAVPHELARRTDFADVVWAVQFGPDGRTLVTGGVVDAMIRLWDVTNPRDPRERDFPFARTDIFSARSLSPDGRLTATWSIPDKAVRIIDMTDPRGPRSLATLPDNRAMPWMTAFSPDGRRLAVAGPDETIRLWDTTRPEQPQHIGTFTGHTVDASAVTFAPDGRTFASASVDHTARVWETDTDQVAALICRRVTPKITRAEWDRYFPELPYTPPCR